MIHDCHFYIKFYYSVYNEDLEKEKKKLWIKKKKKD